jgi:hypothetical protein
MAEPKPFASLSSGLLARKGAAKPAMRPQGFGQMGMGLEDLGWNDMGHSQQQAPAPNHDPQPEHVPSSIAALTPAPRLNGNGQPAHQPAEEPIAISEPVAPPPVVEQQRAVAEAFSEKPQPQPQREPQPIVARQPRVRAPARRERSETGSKAKAAFTLRLDPERHLKLRLACAVTNRSAQQIVTEALDEYLALLPEVEALASRVPAKAGAKKH